MISVIIPVLNESPTIASVIEFARVSPNVSEVIVVDDGSIDGTPEIARRAGAKVVTSTLLGKGASMEDGLWAASNELIVFLDGDLAGLREDLIPVLTVPLVTEHADFVKAAFSRSSGRVTMLTAKPLISTFFPELGYLEQPLGGIIAARRSLLRKLPLETDYGVDVGLLLDVAMAGATIAQVDIGRIQHDSQPLEVLGDMAKQVVRVILQRAARYGRLEETQILEVQEVERHAQAELNAVLSRVGQPDKLALFDMDGTLLKGRFILNLAQRTNKLQNLQELLDNDRLAVDDRTQRIAALFAGVPREVFEQAARTVPLMPGAAELIVALRSRGYRVGIVSDSYRVASEIVRRRVFADFSLAHLMRFRQGVASGAITLSPAMIRSDGCSLHGVCKQNALLHLCDQWGLTPDRVLAVGDGEPDSCLLRAAGLSVAFQPKSESVAAAAKITVQNNLLEILEYLERNEAPPASTNINWCATVA